MNPIYKVLMGVGIPGTVASVVVIFNALKKKPTKKDIEVVITNIDL